MLLEVGTLRISIIHDSIDHRCSRARVHRSSAANCRLPETTEHQGPSNDLDRVFLMFALGSLLLSPISSLLFFTCLLEINLHL